MSKFTERENVDLQLNLLVQHPYFWPPLKIRHFVLDVYQKLAKLAPSYLEIIDHRAREHNILEYKDITGNWNWGKAFTSAQLQILQNCYDDNKQLINRKTNFKFDSVFSLILAFRHKDVHFRNLSSYAIQILFGMKVPEPQYDQIYVAFWLTKFPKLLLFLWSNFKELLDESRLEFYGSDLQNSLEDLPWFMEKFELVLRKMKSYGCLTDRFTLGNRILEFYQCSPNSFHSVIPVGSTVATLRIFDTQVTFSVENEKKCFSHTKQSMENQSVSGSTLLVFVYKLSKDQFLRTMNKDMNDKTIYFTCDMGKTCTILRFCKSVDTVLKYSPLVLNDLDNDGVRRVLNTSIVVGKKKLSRKLKDFLSTPEINSIIIGEDLSKLPNVKPLWLFRNFDLPPKDLVFMPRYIWVEKKNKEMYTPVKVDQSEVYDLLCNNISEKYRLVCITGKPGTGKSKYVEKVAQLIQIYHKSKFVFFFSMCDFLKLLRKDATPENLSIGDIAEVLTDNKNPLDFEKNLVNLWLNVCTGAEPSRLEIFFDGLDEVSGNQIDIVYHIMSLIRDNCLSVRVWITCRDEMAKEIARRYEIPTFRLEPLTEKQSIQLILQNFVLPRRECFSKTELKQFKRRCYDCLLALYSSLNFDNPDFTIEPLHCQKLTTGLLHRARNICTQKKFDVFLQFLHEMETTDLLLQAYSDIVGCKLVDHLEKFKLFRKSLEFMAFMRNLKPKICTGDCEMCSVECDCS